MDIKKDVELLFEIGCFRLISRSWKRFLLPNAANNAEHTLRVIWIVLTLAKYENANNQEKILKMALVHDLTESRCGDVDYLSRQYVNRHEDMAIEDILKDTVHNQEMIDIWKEYEKKESIEAKIVKDADNLDVELELKEFKACGNVLANTWKEGRRDRVFTRLYTESAKKLWDEIESADIHDWHVKGRNRLNAGDWKKET